MLSTQAHGMPVFGYYLLRVAGSARGGGTAESGQGYMQKKNYCFPVAGIGKATVSFEEVGW